METDDSIDDAWGELVDASVVDTGAVPGVQRAAARVQPSGPTPFVGDALSELIMGVQATTSLMRLSPETPTAELTGQPEAPEEEEPDEEAPEGEAPEEEAAEEEAPEEEAPEEEAPEEEAPEEEAPEEEAVVVAPAAVLETPRAPVEDAPRAVPPLQAPAASHTGMYLGAAVAVAVVVLLVFAWPGQSQPESPVPQTSPAATRVADNAAAAALDPVGVADDPVDVADEPVDVAENDPPTLDDDPPIPGGDPEGFGFATNSPAYRSASERYDSTRAPQALLEMTLEACNMDDGPRARAAFRKLRPTELRKQAYLACGKQQIDVRGAEKGPTAAELVRRAQRLLASNDAELAMDTARAANLLERRADAVLVMGEAACVLSDSERALSMLRHLQPDDQALLIKSCAGHGLTLESSD